MSNITLPRAVVEFLLGEGPLDGVWYGDEHPTNPRPYWWRKHIRAALAEPEQKPEPESKTPAWWMDGLTVTLMREGVNKHRAREIAIGYWEAYCQIPGNEEDET